jgi:hypothetical protein
MNGVDKNKAQIIAMVIVVVITLVVAVAVAFAMPAVLETVAQSIANLARTSVQLIMRFIQIIRKMIAALQAVSKSIQSGLSIGAAFPQRDLVKIKADMSYLEQESDFAAKDVELDQSRMKTIFERYNSNTKTLFQQMLDSQRTGRTIASYV